MAAYAAMTKVGAGGGRAPQTLGAQG